MLNEREPSPSTPPTTEEICVLPGSPPIYKFEPSWSQPARQIITQGSRGGVLILHFKDAHATSGESPHEIEFLGRYQLEIARELERQRIKDVFVESLTHDIPADASSRSVYLPLAAAQRVFPSGLFRTKINQEQLELLVEHGAAHVYAALSPQVSLHATISPDDHALARRIFRSTASEAERRHYTFDFREGRAVAAISTFLAEPTRPDRVGLIFGAGHRFESRLPETYPGDSRPRLETVGWPRLIDNFVGSQVASQLALAGWAAANRQPGMVESAAVIDVTGFGSIVYADVQLRALDKLCANFENYPGGAGEVKELLLGQALSAEVAQKIESLYGDFVNGAAFPPNVFSAFDARIISRRIASCKVDERRDELLQAATHIMTL